MFLSLSLFLSARLEVEESNSSLRPSMELLKKFEKDALSLPITDFSVVGVACSSSSSSRMLIELKLAEKSDLRDVSASADSASTTSFCNMALAPAAVNTPEALSSCFILDDNLSGSILRDDFIFSLSLSSLIGCGAGAGGFALFYLPAAKYLHLPIVVY